MTQNFLELTGEFYQSVLARMHDEMNPNSYFEIGTLNGDTLRLAKCCSVAVDPALNLSQEVVGVKPACHFYQYESDYFFSNFNLKSIFGEYVDLAFLDGLHLFEFLLRDLINTEKYCRNNSVIVLHDCVPGDHFISVRDPSSPKREKSAFPGYWTGDVWKIIPVIQKYRPDIKMEILDANPTGLVVLTCLNNENHILHDNYNKIMEEFLDLDLEDYGAWRLHDEANISSANSFNINRFRASTFQSDINPITKWESFPDVFQYVDSQHRRFNNCDGKKESSFKQTMEYYSVNIKAPLFHDDPDNAHIFDTISENNVVVPKADTICERDVRLVGYRAYLTRSGELFIDENLDSKSTTAYLHKIAQSGHFENEDTGLRPLNSSGLFRFSEISREVQIIEGSAISICSFEPSNYGSFLFRTLPKLAGLGDYKRETIVSPAYTQSMRDLLQMAGVTLEKLIEQKTHIVYHLQDATIPSVRNSHAIIDDESRRFFKELRDKFGCRTKARRVFVARMDWRGSEQARQRIMRNERELADKLQSEGFEVVFPEKMTAKEQIEVFSSADTVVGASGSAMFNVVFCHPGTVVIDIESEPHWIFSHQNLFSSCGHKFGIIEALSEDRNWSVHHKAFKVNIDAVVERAITRF